MIPTSTLTVKWTFPFDQYIKIEQIATFQQFEVRVNQFLKIHEYKVIPLMRQGEKCCKIQKPAHKQKIKQKFKNLQPQKTALQNEQSWSSLTSSKKDRKSSFTKKQDILMEFRYKQEHEQTMKIQKHCKQLQKTYKQITDKMEMAQKYQTYFNHLRHIKYENKAQCDNDMVTMKIYFLVSEPLVRLAQSKIDRQVKHLPIMRQSIKIHEHMQKIKQLHQKNRSINLKFQKIYISHEKLLQLALKLQKQPEKDVDLIVLQVYTQLYEQNNQFYVCLQSQNSIGLQNRNVTLNNLFEILNKISKLHCIVLVGPNMRKIKQKQQDSKNLNNELKPEMQPSPSLKKASSNSFKNSSLSKIKKKQWYMETQVPIVIVGVFDAEKDIFFTKVFMQVFYSNLFNRHTVSECCEFTTGQFKKVSLAFKQNNNIAECCCMHGERINTYNWGELEQKIGLYTIHKIFSHQNYKDFSDKLSNDNFSKEIVKLVLNIEHPDTTFSKNKELAFKCEDDANIHRNFRHTFGDFLKYNLKPDFNLLPKRQKTIWEFGKLLTQKIQDNRYSRFRPLVLYNLITKILMKNTLNIIIIKGCSKSGKTQFITLAECYVSSRTNRIKFKRFRDWLKIYRENKSIQAVKQILADVFEQNQQKQKIIPQKLVLSVGKVYYEVEEQYEHFLAQIISCQQIVKHNIVILSALGESQNIHNEKVQKYVTKFAIPSIEDSQMKYLILRDQQTQLKKDPQDIYILNQIIKQFTSNVVGQTNIRSQIHYSSFCKQLRSIIEIIKNKKIETQQEMRKATREQMKKYINKTKTALDELKYSNKQVAMAMSNVQCSSLEKCSQVWAVIGFFCSFRQGFFLCEFNKPIALLDLNLFQQISKKQFYQIRLYRISTNNKERQSVRQQKSYSIRPELQCFYYFNQKKKLFRQRKIDYFFNFYYLVYKVIRKTKDKFSKLHERIYQNYGIFMYDFKEELLSVISSDQSRKKMLEPQQLQYIISDDGTEQRNFIYNTVVQKHIYIFIEFLKEIIGDWKEQKYETQAQEQKNLLLIIYSILMASICHRNLDHVLGSKKQQLNEQIKKFVTLNQQSTKELVVIALAQTCAIIDYQNLLNVQNIIKNSQDWSYKDIMRILANLQLYQINKRQIQNKIKSMKDFLSTENLKIQHKEEQLNKFAKQIQINMTDTIQRIKFSLETIHLFEQIKSRHYQCILDVILTKILIKFTFFNHLDEQNSIFNSQQLTKSLKQITENIKRVDERYVFRNYQIRTCFAYLKTKINLLSCKESDISVSTKNLSDQFLEMYQYVKQKLNPKTLFQSSHIALFMKAGCLKVFQRQYNYVRMNNIISKFLKKKLGNKSINLLFLNLSQKNFQMVVEEQPIIDYFILTVDCYEDKNKNLFVVLQDNMMSCKQIAVSEFLDMLKKIKFRFLILSGSYSHKLCDEIKSYPNPEMIAVIALTFNKQQLDLSTYPISQGSALSPVKVVQDFIKVQNTQRILEMTICSILTYLAKKQREFKPNKDNIQEIVKSAIKVAADVLTSWYKNRMKQFQNIYQIRNKVYVNDNYRSQFPCIPAGDLKNLSSEVIAIPSNFNDDTYYENVGRIQIIAQIMKQLSSRKLKIVQIAGGQRSGKTQILKQVGWFCRTRKIFQSGVYRYDIKQLIDNKYLKTMIKDLNRQYPSNKNLLVLMDNLQIEYLQSHAQFFQNLFDVMSTKPVSLVYTVSNSPNCAQSQSQESISYKNKNNLVNKKLLNYLPNCKLYGFRTFDVNKLNDVEKICIALINFRNRGKMSYASILETYFKNLYNLSITKNDSSISLNKKISHAQSLGAQKTKKDKQRKKNKNKIELLSKKMRSDDGYYEPPSFNKINSVQNDFEKNKKQKQESMLQNKNRLQEDEIGQQSSIMDNTQNNDSQMQISQQIIISKQIKPAVQQIDLAESKQIIEDPHEDDNSSQKQSKISGLMLPLNQPSKSFISSIPMAPKKSTNEETPLYTLTHTSSKSQQLSDLAYVLEMCKQYKIKRTKEEDFNLNPVQRWFKSQQEVIQPQEIYEQNYLDFDIERMIDKLVQGEHNWLKLEICNRAYFPIYDSWKPL